MKLSKYDEVIGAYKTYISDFWYRWPQVRSFLRPHHYKSMGKKSGQVWLCRAMYSDWVSSSAFASACVYVHFRLKQSSCSCAKWMRVLFESIERRSQQLHDAWRKIDCANWRINLHVFEQEPAGTRICFAQCVKTVFQSLLTCSLSRVVRCAICICSLHSPSLNRWIWVIGLAWQVEMCRLFL